MSFDRRAFMIGSVAAASAVTIPGKLAATPSSGRTHRFGWVRDRPDPADALLSLPSFTKPAPRPAAKDLSANFPPAYDQGQLNSCTANAIAAAVQYARRAHSKPGDFVPSRLFIYYMERKAENSVYVDGGAQIRDGITSVVNFGVPPENMWPYDGIGGDTTTEVFPSNARAIIDPPAGVRTEAAKYATISRAQLSQSVDVLESVIAAGYPFVFGFTVYDNFNDATTALRAPGPNDHITPFGHAVLVTGYDQTRKVFRIRNSWGPTSNDHGYFDMDYAYVLSPHLASDFWVIYQTLGIA